HELSRHQSWSALVGAAADRIANRSRLWTRHWAAGDAARRLLLRAADSWGRRALPGLRHPVARVRLGDRWPLRRAELPAGQSRSDAAIVVQLLCGAGADGVRAVRLPLHRRQAA